MITHQIHYSEGIAVVRWQGKVSDSDLPPAVRALFEGGEWEPGFSVFIDAREADLVEITPHGLRTVAGVVAGYGHDHEGQFKTAMVVSRDLTFGMGRMYEVYSEASQETLRVFRDLQQALHWVGAPPDFLE